VVNLFLSDAPARLQAIDEAVVAGDAPGLASAAHALKGAASNVGAKGLQALCSALEADAAGGLPANAQARVAKLRLAWEQTQAALRAWL